MSYCSQFDRDKRLEFVEVTESILILNIKTEIKIIFAFKINQILEKINLKCQIKKPIRTRSLPNLTKHDSIIKPLLI
jgi:hypothetical protein